MILRARTILPISRPPIENGGVVVSGNRIQAVGSWPDLQPHLTGGILDLGEIILLPGLVNAHCHLDYTDMAGLLPPPKKFTDWIPLMLAAKAEWSYTEYARSWLHGAKMLVQTGTTTVADIEAVPELLPEMWDATPLRVFSFLEMTGVRSKRDPSDILRQALDKSASLAHPRCRTALSPHAPYSTSPELLRLCAQAVRENNFSVATHVAESVQEFDMFCHAQGEMYQWLLRNGRDMSDCGLGSPVQHMDRAGLIGQHFIGVHLNCLAFGDTDLLGRRRAHVVHCPRSHEYFRHPPFPQQALAEAGVNLCLGTDSLATVRRAEKENIELNLFAEMRAFSAAHREVPAEAILQMATMAGARALGMSGLIGELSVNAYADLIAIPFTGKKADIYNAVVHHGSTVSASMIDGQWAIAP